MLRDGPCTLISLRQAGYLGLALKAMRTCAQLVETLNHGRGKGPVQRVVVERVTVRDGGQAVVGAVGSRD